MVVQGDKSHKACLQHGSLYNHVLHTIKEVGKYTKRGQACDVLTMGKHQINVPSKQLP